MRVLLTGAAGFIGSHVARRMLAAGHEVHAVLRPGSDTWRIADLKGALRVVPCDVLSTGELGTLLERVRPALCVHLAWYVEPGKYLDGLENLQHLSASLALATRLAELGCRRFVGVGTCLEYLAAPGALSERSATGCDNLYVASKLGLGLALEQLGRATRMQVAWARLFYLYGPFEDGRRLVPSVVRALLAGEPALVTRGEQVRDFLHVEDMAAAIWAVATSELTGPVNVGSGRPETVREVVSTLGAILERSELIRYDLPYGEAERMSVLADNSRLRDHTGWSPRYALEEGLRHTVEWWKARSA